jgi:hypothetical protein
MGQVPGEQHVDFERDKRSTRGGERRGKATSTSKAREQLRSTSRGGFDDARGALGFSDKRSASLEISEDGNALRPWMPVPGALSDLLDEPSMMGVGGSFDLLESERERRRRLQATRLMDTLRAETPSVRSVGEAFGESSGSSKTEEKRGHPLASLKRAWRPRSATPLRAFSSSVELGMNVGSSHDDDELSSIDLAPEEAAGLAQLTLEKGPEWVYGEISKLRSWAEERRERTKPEGD